MTDEEADYALLNLATKDTRKFAIGVAYPLRVEIQHALERMQISGWVRLIDVSASAASQGQLTRIFLVSPEAIAWFEVQTAKREGKLQ